MNLFSKKELIAPNADVEGTLQPLNNEDITFRFLKDSIASEGNNFLTFAENGCFCFISILMVNAIFKKHQLAVTVKFYDEKFNCQTIIRQFDGKDDMKMSDDKLSTTFMGNKIQYNPEKRTYEVSFREDKPVKDGPKVEGEWLNLTFTADCEGFKLGNGYIYYGKDKEDYAFLALSMPRALVSGSINIEGKQTDLKGYGFVTKNLSNITPHKLANTFHHCKLITPELTLASCKIETPKAFENATYNWGYLVENKNLVAVTTRTDAKWLQDGIMDPDTKYVVPTKVRFSWEGKTREGKDFSAEVITETKPENLMCRFDVLGHIPAIFKAILEKLIAKPIFYQFYEELEGKITIDGETKVVRGRCLHEYHFISDSN